MRQDDALIMIVSARVYHDGPHDGSGRLVIVETRFDDPDDRMAYRFKSSEAAANFIRDELLRQEIPDTICFCPP
jgi:hypothetical protein